MAEDALHVEPDDGELAELPHPDSDELRELVSGHAERAVYRLLWENRDTPLTMQEIRRRLGPDMGGAEQLDRRRRNLHPSFNIEKHRQGHNTRYRLVSRKARSDSADLGISERDRAVVLQFGRCAMCGRTPLGHGVVLQVDHKMPQSWGGTSDIENLQPLCEECNRGKKNHFKTLDEFGPQIRAAAAHLEPHRRIGELLKSLRPHEVRSDIIEMVAHQHQHQDDWQKRLRELRELGWVITWRKAKDRDGRVRVFWKLEKWAPWPQGTIRSEVARRERLKKESKRKP